MRAARKRSAIAMVMALVMALVIGMSGSGSLTGPLAAGEVALAGPQAHHIAKPETRLAASAGSQSLDWAGYAVMGRHDTSVSGQWTVPRIGASSALTASALWIGIDGISDHHLIQTGTEQDSLNGRTEYYAWWEILPAAAVRITAFSVQPGDRISAKIAQVSAGLWRITISDARGGTFSTIRAYGGSGTSAEWIEEAPYLGRRQAQLAHLGAIGFDHATVNGANPRLSPADEITLVQNNAAAATPSGPDSDRDGFQLGQGAVGPAPPHS
jgi:Peptidase A4 family